MIYKNRRQALVNTIKDKYSDKKGIVLLLGGLENKRYQFRQNSTFYYMSGLTDPALVGVIDLDNKFSVYAPRYGESRSKWVGADISSASKEELASSGINHVEYLGQSCKGYSLSAECAASDYENLINYLSKIIASGSCVFTNYSMEQFSYDNVILEKLFVHVPGLKNNVVDISNVIASMRRTKSQHEIELIYKAVETTMAAQAAVAGSLQNDTDEFVVKAGAEFVFGTVGATCAFPSIVATGINATVLHYTKHNGVLKNGDLVIVDIGAEQEYYCGDLSRTYPVSGTFNARQRELYNIVLKTQEHVALFAKPGYWINNKENPEKSLQHIALEFLKKKGLDVYFTHGIGHYLGLDVHDVGSYAEPLKEGDVITIEPGLYIPKEKIGIRIEDNYWIVNNGNVCLSEDLPRTAEGIEELMAESESDEDCDSYDDECDD